MKAKLLVLQGKPRGKYLVFADGEYYFGRGDECQVRPNSDMVSRQHCLLRVTDAGVYLRDLGSRNGTLVNGTLIDGENRLRSGDQIQIGPLVFEMRLEEPPDTVVAAQLEGGAVPETETMVDFPVRPPGDPAPDSTSPTADALKAIKRDGA